MVLFKPRRPRSFRRRSINRFPGDPGAGKYYVGVAGGPRQLTSVSGTNMSDLNAFADWSQRPAGIYHDYSGATNYRVDAGKLDNAINANCIPSQSFKMWNEEEPPDQVGWKPTEITAGLADSDLTASANACIARAPWPIWLCYLHEPENNYTTSTTATQYRAAYRYIVQFFRNAGVTNVAWMPIYMCPYTFRSISGRDWRWWHADWNGGAGAGGWHTDRMMDLFGIDVYNAQINSTTFENFNTFISDTVNKVQGDGFGTMPPMVIPEFGMASDTVSPNWGLHGTRVRDWALVNAVGIVYWNHNTTQNPSRYDFVAAADPDGTKLAGWRTITTAATDYVP